MCYSVSSHKNKKFCNFVVNKLKIVSLKFLREQLPIPTDNSVVVARWSFLINSRNMAKSAIHKSLTEIRYGIKN